MVLLLRISISFFRLSSVICKKTFRQSKIHYCHTFDIRGHSADGGDKNSNTNNREHDDDPEGDKVSEEMVELPANTLFILTCCATKHDHAAFNVTFCCFIRAVRNEATPRVCPYQSAGVWSLALY